MYVMISLQKQFHAIYRDSFWGKNANFVERKKIFQTFSLKINHVGIRKNRLAEAVLTSTHNVCFG